jgi:hypothetical protein
MNRRNEMNQIPPRAANCFLTPLPFINRKGQCVFRWPFLSEQIGLESGYFDG